MNKTIIEHYEVSFRGRVGDLLDSLIELPSDAQIVSIESESYSTSGYDRRSNYYIYTLKAERDVSSD